MFSGVLYALGACLIWGLIFVLPQFMSGFSSLEIALGRYFFYGVFSLLIFVKARIRGRCRYRPFIWKKALYFSLVCTVLYYTLFVLSLRHCSPAVCAIIQGISPITIAFFGNWMEKKNSFRILIVPSILILIGLVIINIPYFSRVDSPSSYFFGLICAFLPMAVWSWYVVTNARLLNRHPEIKSNDWSTLIGVLALFWVAIFSLILSLFFNNQFQIEKYFTLGPELMNFLIGSAILGLLCSWLGSFLWNQASLRLPISLAGQLMIFETVFGAFFVYLVERRIPPIMEQAGIVILLLAVVNGFRQFAKQTLPLGEVVSGDRN